ncbi:hypothetical protein [Ornithinimicrobium kibberense]
MPTPVASSVLMNLVLVVIGRPFSGGLQPSQRLPREEPAVPSVKIR